MGKDHFRTRVLSRIFVSSKIFGSRSSGDLEIFPVSMFCYNGRGSQFRPLLAKAIGSECSLLVIFYCNKKTLILIFQNST